MEFYVRRQRRKQKVLKKTDNVTLFCRSEPYSAQTLCEPSISAALKDMSRPGCGAQGVPRRRSDSLFFGNLFCSLGQETTCPFFMPIITALTISTRKNDYVNIFVDGDFYVQVHIDIITKYGLKKGEEISTELGTKLHDDKRTVYVKQTALRFVCYKPRTEYQVRTKLRDKEFTQDEITLAIDFLYEFDYLNDDDYCRMFINDYLLRKKTSSKKLFQELKKRGIHDERITQALDLYYPKDDTYQMAIAAANKKWRTVQYKPIEKQRKSVSDYLQRQGFDWNTVKQVLNELFQSDMH